jgi:hypothetical protein
MGIIDFIRQKQSEYLKLYQQFLKDNPGKIMCSYGIQYEVCKNLIKTCNTIEDIEKYEERCLKLYKNAKGPNGHYIAAKTCKEIIEEYGK